MMFARMSYDRDMLARSGMVLIEIVASTFEGDANIISLEMKNILGNDI